MQTLLVDLPIGFLAGSLLAWIVLIALDRESSVQGGSQ